MWLGMNKPRVYSCIDKENSSDDDTSSDEEGLTDPKDRHFSFESLMIVKEEICDEHVASFSNIAEEQHAPLLINTSDEVMNNSVWPEACLSSESQTLISNTASDLTNATSSLQTPKGNNLSPLNLQSTQSSSGDDFSEMSESVDTNQVKTELENSKNLSSKSDLFFEEVEEPQCSCCKNKDIRHFEQWIQKNHNVKIQKPYENFKTVSNSQKKKMLDLFDLLPYPEQKDIVVLAEKIDLPTLQVQHFFVTTRLAYGISWNSLQIDFAQSLTNKSINEYLLQNQVAKSQSPSLVSSENFSSGASIALTSQINPQLSTAGACSSQNFNIQTESNEKIADSHASSDEHHTAVAQSSLLSQILKLLPQKPDNFRSGSSSQTSANQKHLQSQAECNDGMQNLNQIHSSLPESSNIQYCLLQAKDQLSQAGSEQSNQVSHIHNQQHLLQKLQIQTQSQNDPMNDHSYSIVAQQQVATDQQNDVEQTESQNKVVNNDGINQHDSPIQNLENQPQPHSTQQEQLPLSAQCNLPFRVVDRNLGIKFVNNTRTWYPQVFSGTNRRPNETVEPENLQEKRLRQMPTCSNSSNSLNQLSQLDQNKKEGGEHSNELLWSQDKQPILNNDLFAAEVPTSNQDRLENISVHREAQISTSTNEIQENIFMPDVITSNFSSSTQMITLLESEIEKNNDTAPNQLPNQFFMNSLPIIRYFLIEIFSSTTKDKITLTLHPTCASGRVMVQGREYFIKNDSFTQAVKLASSPYITSMEAATIIPKSKAPWIKVIFFLYRYDLSTKLKSTDKFSWRIDTDYCGPTMGDVSRSLWESLYWFFMSCPFVKRSTLPTIMRVTKLSKRFILKFFLYMRKYVKKVISNKCTHAIEYYRVYSSLLPWAQDEAFCIDTHRRSLEYLFKNSDPYVAFTSAFEENLL